MICQIRHRLLLAFTFAAALMVVTACTGQATPTSSTTTAVPGTNTTTDMPGGIAPASTGVALQDAVPNRADWPNESNTGPTTPPTEVIAARPNGDRETLTDNGVIDGKIVNNGVVVLGRNAVIRNSIINGWIDVDCDDCSLTLDHVTVNAGTWQGFAVGVRNLTILSSNISGARGSIACAGNCVIRDSYTHGQYLPPDSEDHLGSVSSFGGENILVDHNTIWCEPVDNAKGGGCTASFALFGHFAPLNDITVQNNWFKATPGGYCTTFGWNPGELSGKPYGDNPTNIRVINNVVERAANGSCGVWGPDTSFKASGAGNVWSDNVWSDGMPWEHS